MTTKIKAIEILKDLGSKPSVSEERGLALMRDTDRVVLSPGISTAGFAEIRMAKAQPLRKIIATTIDEKGLEFAKRVIEEVGLSNQIETRYEDIRDGIYAPDSLDFIYARLVLHYLSAQDLDNVLTRFRSFLKPGGRLFIVVRSEKNIDRNDVHTQYDPKTKLTIQPHYGINGVIESTSVRYFHTPESILEHIARAKLHIESLSEYQELLYKDFMRMDVSSVKDHVIEVVVSKKSD